VTLETPPAAPPDRPAAQPAPAGAAARDFYALTKPGITRLVVMTAAAGYYLAAQDRFDLARFGHTLLGTALVASGTNALNQWWERDVDARMQRTRDRPLPAGRLDARAALGFGLGAAALGVAWLLTFVNALTALLAALTTVSYVLCYTPLKKRTPLNTLVGAVPGALPVLGGWTAASGRLAPAAWLLFAVLFLWQLPHFLALAWMYREDYARGRLRMLSMADADGRRTGRHAVVWAVLLLAASLLLTPLGVTGPWYAAIAAAAGGALVAAAAAMAAAPSFGRARRLFLASVIYLPLMLVVMALDKA
jgi:protoheme IX farnesyltransferase